MNNWSGFFTGRKEEDKKLIFIILQSMEEKKELRRNTVFKGCTRKDKKKTGK